MVFNKIQVYDYSFVGERIKANIFICKLTEWIGKQNQMKDITVQDTWNYCIIGF